MEIENEVIDNKIPQNFVAMSKDRAEGCLLGMGVGDALGAPFEFEPVKKIDNLAETLAKPLVMESGKGRFQLEAGQWTDDTSQGLCLVEAFVERAKEFKIGFEPKRFIDLICNWWYQGHNNGRGNEGSVGMGGVVFVAIKKWHGLEGGRLSEDPITHSFAATFPDGNRKPNLCDGNGSTMRCAAPAVFGKSLDEAMFFAYQQSLVTTPGLQSAACAALMAYLSYQAIHSAEKDPNLLKKTLLSPENLVLFLDKLLELNQKFDKKYQIPKESEDYQLMESLCRSKVSEAVILKETIEITTVVNAQNKTTTTSKITDTQKITAEDKDYNIYIEKIQASSDFTKVKHKKSPCYYEREEQISPSTKIKIRYRKIEDFYLNWRIPHSDYTLDGPTSNSTYYGSYVMSGMALVFHILHNTNSFDEAVKMAALMQGDADSNAAVVGILAGAIYGRSTINQDWINTINQHPLNQNNDMTIVPFVEQAVGAALDLKSNVEIGKTSADQPVTSAEETFRQSIIEKLEAYVTRIESYQGNYAQGFWFFPESRAINRELNYKLAKQLLNTLKEGNENIASVFTNLEAKKNAFADDKALPWYGVTGIHSVQLKEIIEAVENMKDQTARKKL